MKYAALSLLIFVLSAHAGKKNNEWVRISFPKSQPSDLLMQDSLSELKAVIASKKFNDAYQMLNTVTLGGQLIYMKYLLSEVQFDYLVSKKDGSYQFIFPKQISGNFLIKNRNTRNFFNYVLNEKRKESNNDFMVLQLKNLKNIDYQSVFAKRVKTLGFLKKLGCSKLHLSILRYILQAKYLSLRARLRRMLLRFQFLRTGRHV